MDHFVRLDPLPDDLKFPANLQEKIHYDPERKGLVFHGPMAKREYDMLCPLNADTAYRNAIDELFRIATWEAEQRGPGTRRMAITLGIGVAVAVLAFVVWCIAC